VLLTSNCRRRRHRRLPLLLLLQTNKFINFHFRLASGSSDNTIRIWDVESGKPLGEPLVGHSNWVNSVTFSPDGKKLPFFSLKFYG